MWDKLDEQKRKIVGLIVAVMVIYIAYRFSFSHAIEAYQLNSRLKKEAVLQNSDAAYPHLNKKYLFYQKVLAGYGMKKEDMDTKLWQTVSDIAIGQKVSINYDPSQIPLDSTLNNIYIQQFGFKGDYVNIVRLLDTLSKTDDVGRISTFSLSIDKNVITSKPSVTLQATASLTAIER